MLPAILVSLGIVFLAELGDKSQLITMTYALRHRWWVVLTGVGIAAFLVHGLSVLIGHSLGLALPDRPIAVAAAIAFLAFAAWTWRDRRVGDEGDDDAEDRQTPKSAVEHRYVVLAVVSSFVLAELGDKTMLATVALASDRNWAGVWIGATAGMVLADGAAIAVGRLLHQRLPERLLHGLASILFLLFGLWMLFDAALGRRDIAVVAVVSVAAAATLAGAVHYLRGRRSTRAALARGAAD